MEKNIQRLNLESTWIDWAVVQGNPVIFHHSGYAERVVLELFRELLKEKTLGGYDNQYFKDVTKEVTK
jgi:hypothetical protein